MREEGTGETDRQTDSRRVESNKSRNKKPRTGKTSLYYSLHLRSALHLQYQQLATILECQERFLLRWVVFLERKNRGMGGGGGEREREIDTKKMKSERLSGAGGEMIKEPHKNVLAVCARENAFCKAVNVTEAESTVCATGT